MDINRATSILLPLLFFLAFSQESVHGRPLLLSMSRPKPDDAALFARWLVSQSSWGVLNTIASDMGGAPFGNVVSFSDGLPDKGRGIPYFYLTTLDPTARNALKDERSSFTISEYAIGTCGKTDPENPSCAKITLVGKLLSFYVVPIEAITVWMDSLGKHMNKLQLKLLNGDPKETSFAQTALFTKHPEMKGWPKGHNFQIFKLEIEKIFMINWFGGPKPLTVDQYLQAKMDSHTAIA